jgi:hypothetical protein
MNPWSRWMLALVLLLLAGGVSYADQSRTDQRQITVTYEVGDLVVPDHAAWPVVKMWYKLRRGRVPMLQPPVDEVLLLVIERTIAPNSWAGRGGTGTLQYYPLGLAVVVRNSPRVHQEIRTLLRKLRMAAQMQSTH